MTTLLATLKGKALLFLAGAGVASLVAILSRVIPNLIGKYASTYLDRALNVNDPADKEVVLALVKWAEHRIPDKGKGKERYQAVAKKIVSMFPVMTKYEKRIATLIEDSVAKMDGELKKKSGE